MKDIATVFVCLALIGLSVFAWAEPESDNFPKLKVAVSLMPPCVMKVDDRYCGFDIDIWEEIAKRLDLSYEYQEMPFSQMFESVKNSESSIALGGISITEKREEIFDFSHPYFKAGLMILSNVGESDSVANSIVDAILGLVFSLGFLKFITGLLAILILFGIILMFIEHFGEDNPTMRKGLPGLMDSCWCVWAQMTTMGFGDIVPKKLLGRALSLPAYVAGAIVLAMIVSTVTAAVTVTALKQEEAAIHSPRDLFNKTVATIKDTTSIDFLDLYDARVIAEKNPEEAFAKFISGEAEAMVYDSPTIMYLANGYQGEKKIAVLPDLFDKQDYGIVFPSGSGLREPVNRVILKIQEDGTYDRIYDKWFGGNS
ncbi:MAG: transporter substrate-binding domain-containing protein [Patescibacteria group bacterium]